MSWGNAKRRAKKKLHSHRSEFISTNAVRAIEKGTSTRLTSKRFFPEIFQMLYVASCCRCWDANRDFWCIYQNQTDSLQKNYLYIYGKAIQAIMNATKSKKIDWVVKKDLFLSLHCRCFCLIRFVSFDRFACLELAIARTPLHTNRLTYSLAKYVIINSLA